MPTTSNAGCADFCKPEATAPSVHRRVKMTWALERWRIGWSTCPSCGSFFPRESLLCAACETRVIAKARSLVQTHEGFFHRALFDWIPGDDTGLSNLLLALKGRGRVRAWRWWAREFLQRHGPDLPWLQELQICAAPARIAMREDHSSNFARALSVELGAKMIGRPLLKVSASKLRGLGRAARARAGVFVKSTDGPAIDSGWLVLADDVVTTGATARAVKQALTARQPFEAWSLAARSRDSCES